MYEVETKSLNQGGKRNLKRFPIDFMFQLNGMSLTQIVISYWTLKQNNLLRLGGVGKI